jgi:esterase
LIDAGDLAALISKLGLIKVHLIGTSYGSFTALAYALTHQNVVQSMALAEPPILQWVTADSRGANLYEEFMSTVQQPAREAFNRGENEAAMRLFIDAFDVKGTFDALPNERRRAVMDNALFFRASALSSDPFPNISKKAVSSLRMPILIIKGERTDELHRMVCDELGRVLPNAKRITIPNAGHGSPRQNPEAFNKAIEDFLMKDFRK